MSVDNDASKFTKPAPRNSTTSRSGLIPSNQSRPATQIESATPSRLNDGRQTRTDAAPRPSSAPQTVPSGPIRPPPRPPVPASSRNNTDEPIRDTIRKSSTDSLEVVLTKESSSTPHYIWTACGKCMRTHNVVIKPAYYLRFLCCWCNTEACVTVPTTVFQEVYPGYSNPLGIPIELLSTSHSDTQRGSRVFVVDNKEPHNPPHPQPVQQIYDPRFGPVHPGHYPQPTQQYVHPHQIGYPQNVQTGPPPILLVRPPAVSPQTLHHNMLQSIQQPIQPCSPHSVQQSAPQPVQQPRPVNEGETTSAPTPQQSLQQSARDLLKIMKDNVKNRDIENLSPNLFSPNPDPTRCPPPKTYTRIIPNVSFRLDENKPHYWKIVRITEEFVRVNPPQKKRQREDSGPEKETPVPEREGGEITEESEPKKARTESSTTAPGSQTTVLVPQTIGSMTASAPRASDPTTVVPAFVHQKYLMEFHNTYHSIMMCQTDGCKNFRHIGDKNDIFRYCAECQAKKDE